MTIELLSEAATIGDIKKVAIVDDAYDLPNPHEILEDSFNRFALALEERPDILRELAKASRLTSDSLDDWEEFVGNEKLVAELWYLTIGSISTPQISQSAQEVLQNLFDDVRLDRSEKLLQLNPLNTLLQSVNSLVVRVGSTMEPEAVADADVIFLDLYLSDEIPAAPLSKGAPPQSAYDRARDQAITYLKLVRESAQAKRDGIAPAFILISSIGTERQAENFRKKAGQMRSRFRFVSKNALRQNQPQEVLAVADIFRTCKACALVEPLQRRWPEVVATATEWVEKKILDLDIPDFGYLYHLHLKKEGQPVLDYAKEVLVAALAERVSSAFADLSPDIHDDDAFDKVPVYFEPPSNVFAELYTASRMTGDRGHKSRVSFEPMSGDLFLDGKLPKDRRTSLAGKKIFAVMSPPCDLINRSTDGPRAKSIFLLEGFLRPPTFEYDAEPEILFVNGRYYIVEWVMKSPSAMPTKILTNRWKKCRITWIGRLKGEHFLWLQSEYLRDLGRIGRAIVPSIYEPLAGRLSVRQRNSAIELLVFGGDDGFAFIIADKKKSFEKQRIAFTGAFFRALGEMFASITTDERLGPTAKQRLSHLTGEMSQILKLIEGKSAAQHRIPNSLTVELHASSAVKPKEQQGGVLIIEVWPASASDEDAGSWNVH